MARGHLLDLVIIDFFDDLLTGSRVCNVVLHSDADAIMIGSTAAVKVLPIS